MQNYKFNKQVLSSFSWSNLTWLGWMLSIGEFLNTTLNLEVLLSQSIQEDWNLKKITHKKFVTINRNNKTKKSLQFLKWFF